MAAPKSMRRMVIRHDSETTYASGGSPASAAKALLAFDAGPPMLQAEKKMRQYVAQYFGARPFLLAGKHAAFGYSLEAVGCGTAGTRPPFGNVLLEGAMTETAKTTTGKVSATKRAVGTPSGNFTYTVTDGGDAKVMRRVTIEVTTGGGSGVAAVTVSAPATGQGDCAEDAYSETGEVLTNSQVLALPNDVEITIGTISPNLVIGDTWTIDIGPSRVVYAPTSDRDNHDSGLYHFHLDDHRWVMAGTRSSFNLEVGTLEFPRLAVQAMGRWEKPTDQSLPTTDYSAFQDPVIADTANTWLCEIHGYAAIMKSFSLNFGQQVEFVNRVGREEIRISDRQVTGNVVIEMPELSAKDYFDAVEEHVRGGFRLAHGTIPGLIWEVRGEAVQLDPVRVEDDRGDAMLNIGLTFTPDTAGGDDEFEWIFM